MKVSTIMPTFNQVEFIEEAIASVVYQGDELVVVDDGSSDGTAEYLDDAGLRHISHDDNRGSAIAINTGFEATTGELVTWVSSDNVHAPDWREKLEAAFTPEVAAVYSAFRYGIGGRILSTPYDPEKQIGQEACFFGPSFLIRRTIWEAAGPVRGKISHDLDHWLRIEEVCWDLGLEIVSIPDVLCDYRVHDKRASVTRKNEYDAPKWLAEAKDRRIERRLSGNAGRFNRRK